MMWDYPEDVILNFCDRVFVEMDAACMTVFGISANDALKDRSRLRGFVYLRFSIFTVFKDNVDWSVVRIARYLGWDRGTFIHGVDALPSILMFDRNMKEMYYEFKNETERRLRNVGIVSKRPQAR